MAPKTLVIVDGILIFHPDYLRRQFDGMIFFDTSEELRYSRRLERDVHERGRTPEGVRAQFMKQVKPMHDQFVEPSKAHAHHVIRDIGEYDDLLELWVKRFR